MPFRTELVTDEKHGTRVETTFEGGVTVDEIIESTVQAINLLEAVAGPIPVVALLAEGAGFEKAWKLVLSFRNEKIRTLKAHPNLRKLVAVSMAQRPDVYWRTLLNQAVNFAGDMFDIQSFNGLPAYHNFLKTLLIVEPEEDTSSAPPAEAQESQE